MLSSLLYAKLDIFTTKAFSPILARIAKGPIQACAEFNPTASHVRLSEAKLDYCVHT